MIVMWNRYLIESDTVTGGILTMMNDDPKSNTFIDVVALLNTNNNNGAVDIHSIEEISPLGGCQYRTVAWYRQSDLKANVSGMVETILN